MFLLPAAIAESIGCSKAEAITIPGPDRWNPIHIVEHLRQRLTPIHIVSSSNSRRPITDADPTDPRYTMLPFLTCIC